MGSARKAKVRSHKWPKTGSNIKKIIQNFHKSSKGQFFRWPFKIESNGTFSRTQIDQLLSKGENFAEKWLRVDLSERSASKGPRTPFEFFDQSNYSAFWNFGVMIFSLSYGNIIKYSVQLKTYWVLYDHLMIVFIIEHFFPKKYVLCKKKKVICNMYNSVLFLSPNSFLFVLQTQ